ncbi:BQ5605_C001g00175 [Microbotryum silenes-dioicae]|uniref:BQ5605_C001g00175 protein n=1 Tax=Microbotryum silenes-dioicae TaxID=796604 RepID=A0A2X0P541_9BASI|nr:BQ5605_C001g00175 [Microbotryum silenes-dioicae]
MFHFVQPATFESTAVPFSAMPSAFDPGHHPRSATSVSSPFGATFATSAPAGFDLFEEYDEYRSRQELEALIRGQEQRRQREAAVLLARRRQQEAEQIRQQALLCAQQEQQQRAKYQALLEQQAAQLEHLRQQEEMKLRAKREIERRQAIQKDQQMQQKQQQQQQQQQHCLRNSLDSTTPPGCPARRGRQPLEHLTGLHRNHQAEVQHPFAPLFRMLFDSGEVERDQDQHLSSAPSAQTPESTKQQVEATKAPPAASAPVAQPPALTEPKAAASANKDQEAPVDSLEDVLGSLFKSLFGVDMKANEQRKAEAPVETQAPTAKRESSSTAPTVDAEKNIQVPIESSVDAQTLDPVEVRIEATQENSVASAEQESAAEKLQRHYQAHLQRRKALATLSSLSAQLEARRSSFAVPQALEFQPSPPPSEHPDSTSNEVAPKLAYKSSNASFLAYEDFLVNLLSKIDEVQSGGDRTVKSARKSLVKDVEAELKTLDQARDEAWEKVSSQHQHEKISDVDDHDNETLKSLIPASEETTATGAAARPTEVATATSESAHAESSSIAEDAPAPTPASAPETEPAQSNKDKPKVEQDDEATTSTEKAAQVTDPVSDVAAQPPVVSTPTPEPVRLTPEALAKLSSHAERRRRHQEDDDNSSASTTTLLESSLEIEEALGAILTQARKLGEQVERMEHAEV